MSNLPMDISDKEDIAQIFSSAICPRGIDPFYIVTYKFFLDKESRV